MADGFLSRWSRRKEAVREGKPLPAEPPAPAAAPAPVVPAPAAAAAAAAAAPAAGAVQPPAETAAAEPPPTLADAQALTPDADFSRYVRADVAPEVKNAAMKKLFSDPHFNIMDRMDVYIDDYNTPDPIPPAMLRQLASAKFLKLFDDEDGKEDKKTQAREVAHGAAAQSVAQSPPDAAVVPPPTENHADPDLRLQQDDAPGPPGPGEGAR
jgi:hypothetical protein